MRTIESKISKLEKITQNMNTESIMPPVVMNFEQVDFVPDVCDKPLSEWITLQDQSLWRINPERENVARQKPTKQTISVSTFVEWLKDEIQKYKNPIVIW